MKKKIIIILLILSFPFYVKATTEDAGFEPLLINNTGESEDTLEIKVYIPYDSNNPLKVNGSDVVPCGEVSTENLGNVYIAKLNVPILFHYSYSINNTYNKEVYAGGKIFYNYSIKEQAWWEKKQDKDSFISLPKDNTCPSSGGMIIQNDYTLESIPNFCIDLNNCSVDNAIELKDGPEELENLLQSSIIEKINKNNYEDLVSIDFPDSNDYNKISNKDMGSLGVDETYNYEVDYWLAGANYAINRTYQYKIYDAYINFKNKANIEYKASAPTDMENYIKVSDIINNDSNDLKSYDSNIFFVPLNHPSNIPLEIIATYKKFGLLNIENIKIDDVTTTASVTVTQNLYNDDGSYKINYRPIDVSKFDVSKLGVTTYIDKIAKYKNWNDWLKQDGNEYVTENVNRIRDSYSGYPDGYDYNVSFSGKSDLNLTNTDWNYSDWTNINRNGSSNFLSNNSKIEQKINTTKNYCEIGEFSDGCNERNN